MFAICSLRDQRHEVSSGDIPLELSAYALHSQSKLHLGLTEGSYCFA